MTEHLQTPNAPTEWVMLDWGTSSLRGALLNAQGQVVQERSYDHGILNVPKDSFADVFESCFGDWMSAPHRRCLISGMAGSRQGWQEAPYCACPVGFSELSTHLLWLDPGRIALVPGLSCVAPDELQTPDVMRGEEVQIFGALRLAKRDSATLVLPGTHSKWAQVSNGQVNRFSTYMTGELFSLLSQHSILSKLLVADADFDKDIFLQGIDHSQAGSSVLHTLFSVRTLGLFDRWPAQSMSSFLSGLLIGEELRSQALGLETTPVMVIGNDVLKLRYSLALQHLDIPCQSWGAEATWAGLYALASATPMTSTKGIG